MRVCSLALAALLLATAAHADEGVDALNRRMMQLYTDGHYEDAIPLAAQIVASLEKSAGPGSREVASALNNEAELYSKLHRYADAEPLYQRSLAIRQAVLGPDHPDTVKSLNRLAELYHAEGKDTLPPPQHPQPQQAPRPAPRPAPAAPPQPPRPSVAQQDFQKAIELNQQAIQLGNQGHFADALAPATQAVAIFEKALAPDNTNLGILLGNLAHLHMQLNQVDKAEPLYQRSVAILEKHPSGREGDLGLMLANLADLCARQKRIADAEAYYRRSLPLLEKGFGAEHANVSAVINNFADLYRSEGKDPDAEPVLKGRWQKTARFALPRPRTMTPEAPPPGADPLDLEKSRQLEQQVYDLLDQKKYALALPVATELQSLLEKMYGKESLAVAVDLDSQAEILHHLGRDSEGEQLSKRAQAIRDASRAVDQISR